ncbi:hypothetical protein ThrDRAFT_00983 [Frankia casuarinae]|nr:MULTISPECIES: glycosyltransferase [Frankia]ETA02944.1 hypothetical protein CcI6DRAFT_01693 [Frankia sp. CcI6]EYT93434.1 hypothetical protein ThrDRAFT_00983 [Frankia casuarinae]KDA43555.1 hypothetical protein BMG523Draft_01674 [Frankia sp. BMG5.23]KEZ36767.1 glycosyl transferase group 1 [Frankia sp. CeD]KFB06232.1 glycosyl transferase group 1 [Frankia sp. Allo2]
MSSTHPILVDCAGARMGGALRFLTELDGYLSFRPGLQVHLVGRDRRIGPGWLARRERPGRYARAIALNNVGFLATRGERWVLLRNVLHFLPAEEARRLPGGLPDGVARTARLVRLFARRADVVVVPTTTMADRVLTILPSLSARLVVRPHPLSPDPTPPQARTPGRFLCPVLFAPFKPMGHLLRMVDAAATRLQEEIGAHLAITVTATDREAHEHGLSHCRTLRFVGRLTPAELRAHQRDAGALLQPTTMESFGYPLAEARLAGIPVIARDTSHNREVAGPVLVPYSRESADDLAVALRTALTFTPRPETGNPFDPTRYFDWLLDAGESSP